MSGQTTSLNYCAPKYRTTNVSILSRARFPSCLREPLGPGSASGAALPLGAAVSRGMWKHTPTPQETAGLVIPPGFRQKSPSDPSQEQSSPGRVTLAICIPACNSSHPSPWGKAQTECALQPPTLNTIPGLWAHLSHLLSSPASPGRGNLGETAGTKPSVRTKVAKANLCTAP